MIESTIIEYDVIDADSVNAHFIPHRLSNLTVNLDVKEVVRTTAVVTAMVIVAKVAMDTTTYFIRPYMIKLARKKKARAEDETEDQ